MHGRHAHATLKRLIGIIAIASMIGLFFGNALLAVRGKSATADEPLHLMGAFMQTHYGDFRIDSRDPPLWLYWAMLPVRRDMIKVDTASKAWQLIPKEHWHDWEWSVATLYRTPGNDVDQVLLRARAMMLILACAGVALVARWSWKLGGPLAATLATALLTFDPNFLAHAPLLKNDVAVSFALAWVGYALWSFGGRATLLRALHLLVAASVCVNIKFSGLLCLFIVPLALLIWTLLERPQWRKRLLISVAMTVALGLAAYLSIWSVYRFRFAPAPDVNVTLRLSPIVDLVAERQLQLNHPYQGATHAEHRAWKPNAFVRTIIFLNDRRLFPQAWLHGLLYTYQSTISYPAFLLGRYSETGWWYYFPLVVLFKTPLGTLLLLAVALALMRARWSWTGVSVGLPLVLYALMALRTNTNLGIRHILPIFPLLYVMCAVALGTAIVQKRWVRVITPLLIAGAAVESLASFPDYIPFFNQPARPYRLNLLSDSNLDWGQDLILLRQWQRKHPAEKLYLCYFGMADPSYYGIRYTPLLGTFTLDGTPKIESLTTPGIVAISATQLQGTFLHPHEDRYAEFRQREPTAILGESIYLFRYQSDAALATATNHAAQH
jgi:hypothetical protein